MLCPYGRLRCSANFVSWIQKLHDGKSTNFWYNYDRSPPINGKAANTVFAIAAYYSLFAHAADSYRGGNWWNELYLFVESRVDNMQRQILCHRCIMWCSLSARAPLGLDNVCVVAYFFCPRRWAEKVMVIQRWITDNLYLFIQIQQYANANAVLPLYDTTLVVGRCASCDGWLERCGGCCALGRVEVGTSRVLIGAVVEGMPLCWRQWWYEGVVFVNGLYGIYRTIYRRSWLLAGWENVRLMQARTRGYHQ